MRIPSELRQTPFFPRFAERVKEWEDVMGNAVALEIVGAETEYAALREAVVGQEYSMLYKWFVVGPEAIRTVDLVLSRNVAALGEHRVAYGVVVTDDGGMVDDVTVAVLEPQIVLVVGGNPEVEHALRAAAPTGTTVSEKRDEYAVLSLQGPKSRTLLQRLTETDVSDASLPYYSFVSDIAVAGIPAMVFRLGFTAELGYELMVPREHALGLWDAVYAHADLGVTPMGSRALMAARVEGGMMMGGLEYDETFTPFECRLGWTVDLDKGPFRGRDALLAKKLHAPSRVVSVVVSGSVEAADSRPLVVNGSRIGNVTMAVSSPVLDGATLALARVERDYAGPGTKLQVVGPDGLLDATVRTTPVYDPDRRRVRS